MDFIDRIPNSIRMNWLSHLENLPHLMNNGHYSGCLHVSTTQKYQLLRSNQVVVLMNQIGTDLLNYYLQPLVRHHPTSIGLTNCWPCSFFEGHSEELLPSRVCQLLTYRRQIYFSEVHPCSASSSVFHLLLSLSFVWGIVL